MMGEFKAMRDLFRESYVENKKINFSLSAKNFWDTGIEVWEEFEGKKF